MGARTQEYVNANKTAFANVDMKTGNFEVDKVTYPQIDGKFRGFSVSEFQHEGRLIKKFVIHLEDDRNYQIAIGRYSYLTLSVLNSFKNTADLQYDDIIALSAKKSKDDKFSIFVNQNGDPIKWKASFEDLKLTKQANGAKEALRDKIIDKWINDFIASHPFQQKAIIVTDPETGEVLEDDSIDF